MDILHPIFGIASAYILADISIATMWMDWRGILALGSCLTLLLFMLNPFNAHDEYISSCALTG